MTMSNVRERAGEPLHLVDTTMFWSPRGDGVRNLRPLSERLAGQLRSGAVDGT